MELLPAIDLKDEKVVRLTRGDYNQVTIYSDKPLEFAQKWLDAGATWLHLVDLDAALAGKPINYSIIEQIGKLLSQQGKKFEIGGGIRTNEALEQYIEKAQASRVILGTIAYQKPEFVEAACQRYPGKIAVGIDVKDGKVATHGWTEVQKFSAGELAQRFQDVGVSCIVYTDIARDGMLSGYNIEGVAKLIQETTLSVIVAGGLRDLSDLEKLLALKSKQVVGAIAGKSIYENTLDLKEALNLIKRGA